MPVTNYQEEVRLAQVEASKKVLKRFLKTHAPEAIAYEIKKGFDEVLIRVADELLSLIHI